MSTKRLPENTVSIASAIAIAISKNFSSDDVFLIKQLLSCICSNLSLYETQVIINKKIEKA